MLFNFTVSTFLLSMLFSSVGFVLFMYGKKQSRVPHMGFGLVLMIYPYFVSNAIIMGGVGAALVALVSVGVLKLGW